jgi:hypothetical protein
VKRCGKPHPEQGRAEGTGGSSVRGNTDSPRVGRIDGWPPARKCHKIPLTARLTTAPSSSCGYVVQNRPTDTLRTALEDRRPLAVALGSQPKRAVSHDFYEGKLVDLTHPHPTSEGSRIAEARIRRKQEAPSTAAVGPGFCRRRSDCGPGTLRQNCRCRAR